MSAKISDFSAYLPEIFFEILSIDTWKVYRNEGYGYITLPRKPGVHNFSLKCWRAYDDSVKSDLDRFFLGGSQILEDVSYVGMGEKNEKVCFQASELHVFKSNSVSLTLEKRRYEGIGFARQRSGCQLIKFFLKVQSVAFHK